MKLICALLTFLFSLVVRAVDPPPVAWSQTSGLGGPPIAGSVKAIAATAAGDVIAIGWTCDFSLKMRVWKYSASGALLWRYDEPTTDMSAPGGGAIDGAGNSYAASSIGDNMWITKVNEAGTEAWRVGFDAGVGAVEAPTGLVVDSSGDVYVCGWGQGVNQRDLLVLKYNNAGALQWQRRYDGTAQADDESTALAAAPGGGVVVAGYTTATSGGKNIIAIRYNSTGTAQWVHTWDSPLSLSDEARGVMVDDTGSVTVGGNTNVSSFRSQVVVQRLTATGSLSWTTTFNHTPNPPPGVTASSITSSFQNMAFDGTGRLGIAATGRYNRTPSFPPFQGIESVTALDAGGTVTWQRKLGETVMQSGDQTPPRIVAIIGRAGGGFLAGGAFNCDNVNDVEKRSLASIAGDGTVEWCSMIAGGARWTTAIARDAAGNLLVGSASLSSNCLVTIEKRGTIPPPVPPEAVTDPADDIGTNRARGNGTVNPLGLATTWQFEYGATTAYGSSTASSQLAAGQSDVPVSAELTGLAPGSTVHFRLVATSSAGTSYGDDRTFTTLLSPWQNWMVQKFGSLSAPQSAPGDDPDKDGVSNLLEYGFGGEPLVPGVPAGLPVPEFYTSPESGITYFAITWTQNPAATDLLYRPVAGFNLQSFTGINVTVQNLPNNRRRGVAAGFEHFMRVEVQLAP